MNRIDGPLIDCHAHVWEEDMPFVASAWSRPDYAYPHKVVCHLKVSRLK